MEKDNRNFDDLHVLREEFRKDKLERQPVFINVEDAIFTRLVNAERSLTVAVDLFDELAADKGNWLFKYHDQINEAYSALCEVVGDRPIEFGQI